MQHCSMWNWLKALIVFAALTCGLPAVASAHAGHAQEASSPELRQDDLVGPSGNAIELVIVRRPGADGPRKFGACCCWSAAPSCPSHSSGSPIGGFENRTIWDLAAAMRRSKVMGGQQSTRDYTAPRALLDRPPKI